MRFSVAVLLLGVSTVVSALPIAHSTSSLGLEGRDSFDVSDMFERDFDEPATVVMYPRTKYHVALHRSDVNKDDEHWSLRFHPQNKATKAEWAIVHAASNKDGGNGVLETEHIIKGGANDESGVRGYDPSRHNEHHHILGSYDDKASAMAAAKSLEGIKCTEPYPEHNCVDWTKQAVDHLHAQGHIKEDEHKHFTDLYKAHEAEVREKTNTAANRKKAGHPK